MSSDDEYEDLPEYVPVSSQEQLWSDVAPLPQYNGEKPLVVIDYAPEFSKCHDLFRAIVSRHELSDRALKLTDECIRHNSADYSAWYYRRLCLQALGSDLQEELDYTTRWGEESPKNYQVWYHRRWLVNQMRPADPSHELAFIAKILRSDAKNYSAWSHRRFILDAYHIASSPSLANTHTASPAAHAATLPPTETASPETEIRSMGGEERRRYLESELAYSGQLLEDDCRNNSAWNHRFVVIHALHGCPLPDAARRDEINYVLTWITTVPHNEAAYNYLDSFFSVAHQKPADADTLPWRDAPRQVEETVDKVLFLHPHCRFAMELKAKITHSKGDTEHAKQVYVRLAEIDSVRRRLWEWRVCECVV